MNLSLIAALLIAAAVAIGIWRMATCRRTASLTLIFPRSERTRAQQSSGLHVGCRNAHTS